MADKDDAAAVERTARRIFELQNPGKPWPGDATAKAGDGKAPPAEASRPKDSREA